MICDERLAQLRSEAQAAAHGLLELRAAGRTAAACMLTFAQMREVLRIAEDLRKRRRVVCAAERVGQIVLPHACPLNGRSTNDEILAYCSGVDEIAALL